MTQKRHCDIDKLTSWTRKHQEHEVPPRHCLKQQQTTAIKQQAATEHIHAMSARDAVPQVVPGLHAGSKSDFGADIDIDDMIERMGCSKDYYKLEECLGEYDRDWTKCQVQVKQLKACNDRLQRLKQQTQAQAQAAQQKKQ